MLATTKPRRCAQECRSRFLVHGGRGTAVDSGRDAYTCAYCRQRVCALCGTAPVPWPAYICRPCLAPTARPLTAGELRRALERLPEEQPVLFETPSGPPRDAKQTWAVVEAAPNSRNDRQVLPLAAV